MMITLRRRIETVGSHQALISKVADGGQRRCCRTGFHRQRGCLSIQRKARLQTARQRERRPRQVHSAFKNNEIRGG